MPGPLRGLARRIRDQLRPAPASRGFRPGDEAAFAELNDNLEGAFQSVGAAVTSSWEVALADLGRALRARLPQQQAAALLERMSDALVPTLSPLQHAERPVQAALAAGLRRAIQTGAAAEASDPVVAGLTALARPVAGGWEKTVAHLDPLILALPEPEALRRGLARTGDSLREVFEREAQGFGARVSGAPSAEALLDALDAWKQGVVRGVELAIYAARSRLVEAAARLPAAR